MREAIRQHDAEFKRHAGTVLTGTMKDAVTRAKLSKSIEDSRIADLLSPDCRCVQMVKLPADHPEFDHENPDRLGNFRVYRDFEAEKKRAVKERRAGEKFEVNDCVGGSMSASKENHEKASGEHREKGKRCFSRGDKDLAERHQHASDAHAKATSGDYADQLTAQYACSRCIQPAATGLNKA